MKESFCNVWTKSAIIRPPIFPGKEIFFVACFELFGRKFGHLATVLMYLLVYTMGRPHTTKVVRGHTRNESIRRAPHQILICGPGQYLIVYIVGTIMLKIVTFISVLAVNVCGLRACPHMII
jgi:hypothetical protein